MATEADCHAAIQAAIAAIPAIPIASLPAKKGYAFQAYVMARLGVALQNRGWTWVHPAGGPTFATTNGATFASATGTYSCLRNGADDRRLVQELTVLGNSNSSHDLDLCLTRAFVQEPAMSWCDIGTVIEVKNLGHNASMDVARDLLGLGVDLRYPHDAPLSRRIFLVSAHGVTDNCANLIERYGSIILEDMAPPAFGTFATWVANRLRF